MQALVSRYSFALFFLCWFIVFFPGWYGLSYTKLRELQASISQNRERQLEILHPAGEMSQLVQLKAALQQQGAGKSVAILFPVPNSQLPLASDATMLRAVFYPVPVVSRQEIPAELDLLAILVTDISTAATDSAEFSPCQEQIPETYIKEVLCWPILAQ